MVARSPFLLTLLGVVAAAGAHWLPVAPDDGERARGERLATHGEHAVGAFAVDHHGAALRAVATGLGIVDAPAVATLWAPTVQTGPVNRCEERCTRARVSDGGIQVYFAQGEGCEGCCGDPELR